MRAGKLIALLTALTALLGAAPAAAQDDPRVLLYTGTTGYRHADAITQGGPVVKAALEAQGYTVDVEDCDNNGGGANNCDNAAKNPRIFTDENLAQYDAILLFNASAAWAGGGRPGPLWNEDQRAAIIRFVQNGGGIAANHNATDMAAGVVSWDWWDGGENSAVGTLMRGHAATDPQNLADVQVADNHHLATHELPDTYEFGDEHYNFARSVRGTHHVLATLDERTYTPGGNAMGQDHPITWCKLYDGDSVDDGTGTPKPYSDGRVWVSGMGHFGASYTANDGDNNLVRQIVGGVRWAAGEGKKSDCSGTVWSSFKRTILVSNVNGPIGVDAAPDGKVYWTEIGPTQGYESQGFLKVHDPSGEPNNKTTAITIPTRADHGNSEDGVLGMSLEPGFDLSDPAKRDVFIYYSPRNADWPTAGNEIEVGYNQISRFTLAADGKSAVAGSERVILHVPKAKISGNPSGFPGGPTDSGPGHVGGAGLDFDSEGNLYLGVGDDVSPNAPGHNRYIPMDYRAAERWDARKTSANSADLRGKVLRIHPLDDIPADTEPGMGATYSIPDGNMFAPGTAQTRPEIYAMGFRQPFTVHTDAAKPGRVVVGEYCHDNNANQADRAPAGACEWDLVDEPAFMGWPFCVGDNAPINTAFRWNYAANASTGSQYDCSLEELPSDINWAPDGQTAAAPTFDGLETLPGPAQKATVWRKYPNAPGGQSPADFGDLSTGGQSPITGPVYRYDAETAGPGAFPPYYDGSWFIANRGDDSGFWKEVRLRKDDAGMLRVNDWTPANQFGSPNNSFVIPTQFGPDGALYMARWHNGCCRNQLDGNTQHQLIKVEFAVADECLEDTQPPTVNHAVAGREHPSDPDTYFERATLTLTAGDAGCAGLRGVEFRMQGATEWEQYESPREFAEPGTYDVEYRATDRFDNVSDVKTATFTVVETNDHAAPTLTPTLTGTEVEEGIYTAPATLSIAAADALSPLRSIEYRDNQVDEWTKVDFDGEELSGSTTAEFAEQGFHFVEFRATDDAGNTSLAGSIEFSVISGCTYANSDEFDGEALDAERWPVVRNAPGYEASIADGELTLPILDEVDGTRTGPLSFVGQQVPDGDWTATTRVTIEHNTSWQQAGLMLWQSDGNFIKGVFSRSSTNGSRYFELTSDNPTDVRQVGPSSAVGSDFPTTAWIRLMRRGNTISGEFAPDEDGAPGAWTQFASTRPVNTSPPREGDGVRIGPYAGSDIDGTFENTAAFDFFRIDPDELVGCPDADVLPPATSAALDPAQPGPGGTYNGPVTVQLSATDGSEVESIEYAVDDGAWQTGETVKVSAEGAHSVRYRARDSEGNLSAPKSVEFTIADVRDVFAEGDTWSPDALSVPFGASVTWHFDEPAAGRPHDVWLVAPDTDQQTDIVELTDGPVNPGGPPVSFAFRKAGSWTYVCRLHSSFAGGQWTGMVGTVDVGEGDPGPDPDPDPDPDPGPGPGAGGKPPAPRPNPPSTNPITNPAPITPQATAARLGKLRRTSLRNFARRGLRITSACESGMRGKAQVRLSKRQARKIGLKRATTLASKRVTCGANDRVSVRLKPKKKLARKLRRARRTVTATVKITVGSSTDTARLVLRRG